jgi:UDP-N-acetylmuramoylalanine--D-glutamate ligase
MPLEAIPLPGRHSVSNVAAAVAVGRLFDVAPGAIRQAVERFPGVEHRLETVATVDRVRFVNDSMGTQPDAVIAALQSFERPLVLICGGRAKGLSLEALAQVAAERASAAVLIGESGPEIGRLLADAGLVRMEAASDLEGAVRLADAIAREQLEGSDDPAAVATVLLSPAAASFDMFPDYAARGRAFKRAVAALARRPEPRDRGHS